MMCSPSARRLAAEQKTRFRSPFVPEVSFKKPGQRNHDGQHDDGKVYELEEPRRSFDVEVEEAGQFLYQRRVPVDVLLFALFRLYLIGLCR